MLSIPCGSPTSKTVPLPPPTGSPSSWLWAATAKKPASTATHTIAAASLP